MIGSASGDRLAEFGVEVVARNQRLDHVVEAEEKRLAQREPGGDVLAVDRE
jgi:hypothetical protein